MFERFSDQARRVVVLAAGAEHLLLLAQLADPASTGTQILTALVPLSISEMREHLQHELAHRPHFRPRPTHPNRPANCRVVHHGTDTNPKTTTRVGAAQLTQNSTGGGSDPNAVNDPCENTRGRGTSK